MHQILYDCSIEYSDILDNEVYVKNYKVFANDISDAKLISSELFKAEVGVVQMKFRILPCLPEDNELDVVNKEFYKTYGVLCDAFENMNYKSYLQAYQTFMGTHFSNNAGVLSYVVQFKGITCLVVFRSGKVYIDESEIVFRYDGRNYLYRDNLSSVYIGG